MDGKLKIQKALIFLLVAASLIALFLYGNLPKEEKIVLAVVFVIAIPSIKLLSKWLDKKCQDP